jgi:hypothetical protein
VAVRWPDGSFTGSLLRDVPAAAAPVEPEPEKKAEEKTEKKEARDGAR